MQPTAVFTVLATLFLSVSAIPTADTEPVAASELEKRACNKRVRWQGGGCSASWRNKCHDRCNTGM
jgi:hypothetical protein